MTRTACDGPGHAMTPPTQLACGTRGPAGQLALQRLKILKESCCGALAHPARRSQSIWCAPERISSQTQPTVSKHAHGLHPAADALSRPEDKSCVCSCIPAANLVQWRAANPRRVFRLARRSRIGYLGHPELTTQKGTCMKFASVVKIAAAAAVIGLAGCTDLKPLQAEVADLKAQLAKTQGDVSAAKSEADQANAAASAAGEAASGAQSTANQALAAAHASQSCCDATNEKIDRMFKRSVSK